MTLGTILPTGILTKDMEKFSKILGIEQDKKSVVMGLAIGSWKVGDTFHNVYLQQIPKVLTPFFSPIAPIFLHMDNLEEKDITSILPLLRTSAMLGKRTLIPLYLGIRDENKENMLRTKLKEASKVKGSEVLSTNIKIMKGRAVEGTKEAIFKEIATIHMEVGAKR